MLTTWAVFWRYPALRVFEQQIRKVLTIERRISEEIAVSPDGRTILYTQLDEAGSDLMLVENFR